MNIFELFDNVKQKLKYPKLKYPYKNEVLTIFPVGPNSKHAGQLYVTDGKPYGENKLYCRVQPPAKSGLIVIEWYRDWKERDTELENTVINLVNKPQEICKLMGQQFAYCCFCGTEITSKSSLAVGYGPICAEKWGLPWGIPKDDITENL